MPYIPPRNIGIDFSNLVSSADMSSASDAVITVMAGVMTILVIIEGWKYIKRVTDPCSGMDEYETREYYREKANDAYLQRVRKGDKNA
jgi:hypothetical protein